MTSVTKTTESALSLPDHEPQRAEVERQKRERIVEKLGVLSLEQLNALGIDPTLLD